jgi:hypothetical protein
MRTDDNIPQRERPLEVIGKDGRTILKRFAIGCDLVE